MYMLYIKYILYLCVKLYRYENPINTEEAQKH